MQVVPQSQDIEQLAAAYNKLKQKVQDLGLEGLSVSLVKERTLEASPAEGEQEEEYGVVLAGITKAANEKKLNSLRKYLDMLDVEVSDQSLCGPLPGEKAQDMMVYNIKTNKKSKLINGRDRKGKILMIHLWATEEEECYATLDKFSELAKEKAEEWSNKVVLAQLLVEEPDAEQLEELIDAKGWYNLHHLRLDLESKSADIEVEALPLCILVDQEGVVVKRGTPNKFNFERDINALLAGEPVKQDAKDEEEKKVDWSSMSAEDQEAVVKQLASALKDSGLDDLSLRVMHDTCFKVGEGEKASCDVYVSGYVPEPQEEQFKKITSMLEEKVSDWQAEVVLYKPSVVPKQMDACAQCGKKSEDAFFACAVCESAYTICAECEKNKADNAHKDHPFIKVHKDAHNTDKLLFGPGKIVLAESENKEHEECYCDRCGNQITAVRYKCCHCPNFDFCEACFEKWEKGEDAPEEEEGAHKHKHGCGCAHDHEEEEQDDDEDEDEYDEAEEDDDDDDDDEEDDDFEPCDDDDDSDEETGPHSQKHVFVKLDKPGTYTFTNGYSEDIQKDEDQVGKLFSHGMA